MLLFIIYFSIYRPIQHARMQGNLSLHMSGEIEYSLFKMLSLMLALANCFVMQTVRLMIKMFYGSSMQKIKVSLAYTSIIKTYEVRACSS